MQKLMSTVGPIIELYGNVAEISNRNWRFLFMWLLLIAIFGLIVPNGIFIYWLVNEFTWNYSQIVENHLALGFIIEAFVVMFLLAGYFARNPIGRLKWYWFIVFSLIGGIGFGIPFYWWLNKRLTRN